MSPCGAESSLSGLEENCMKSKEEDGVNCKRSLVEEETHQMAKLFG